MRIDEHLLDTDQTNIDSYARFLVCDLNRGSPFRFNLRRPLKPVHVGQSWPRRARLRRRLHPAPPPVRYSDRLRQPSNAAAPAADRLPHGRRFSPLPHAADDSFGDRRGDPIALLRSPNGQLQGFVRDRPGRQQVVTEVEGRFHDRIHWRRDRTVPRLVRRSGSSGQADPPGPRSRRWSSPTGRRFESFSGSFLTREMYRDTSVDRQRREQPPSAPRVFPRFLGCFAIGCCPERFSPARRPDTISAKCRALSLNTLGPWLTTGPGQQGETLSRRVVYKRLPPESSSAGKQFATEREAANRATVLKRTLVKSKVSVGRQLRDHHPPRRSHEGTIMPSHVR